MPRKLGLVRSKAFSNIVRSLGIKQLFADDNFLTISKYIKNYYQAMPKTKDLTTLRECHEPFAVRFGYKGNLSCERLKMKKKIEKVTQWTG